MSDMRRAMRIGLLGSVNTILVRVLEWLAVLTVALLVVDVVWGVVTRYVLGEQAKWTEELARFLLIWVSMLGGALAFRRREHLGIDFVVATLHSDVRSRMQIVKQAIVCFAAAAVFLYGGTRIVFDALTVEQTTPALGWKMGYVYCAVPLAGVFILLFALEELTVKLRSSGTSASNVDRSSAATEEI